MSRTTVIRRSAVFALLALAGAAAPTRGQGITSPYDFVETSMSLRAIGAYVVPNRGAIDIGPGASYAAGLGYTIRVSGPFAVDVRALYMPTTRRVYDVVADADSAAIAADPTEGLDLVGEADLTLLIADASLRFDITGPRTWHRLQPFVLIGVGGVIRVASDNAVEDSLPEDMPELRARFRTGFTGNVGAGIEWHASDRVTLVAEARDVLWKIHVPDGFFVRGRNIDNEEWVQTAHLSLGLAFRF
jgi:opacity protein-like surface antigen